LKKSDFIHELFEGLAGRYDLFNRLSSLGMVSLWHHKIREVGNFSRSASVLDVCTGTGEIALGLASDLGRDADIHGLDFSGRMLDLARAKAARRGQKVSWVRAAAEELPFPDAMFDGVTMGFAMRNVSSVQKTLGEMRRVLKKDGRVLILELGRPANPLLRFLHRVWLATYVRVVGLFLRGRREPFDYLKKSIYEFFAPKRFLSEMESNGFIHTRYIPLQGGITGIYVGEKN
jgi:demethylmenaquinone methyltransferase / 2-methoxy-6-polyprenyl-1,4-benzoquinol methylase